MKKVLGSVGTAGIFIKRVLTNFYRKLKLPRGWRVVSISSCL
jgi:hypothetical protein